jgi:hypothetical protein
MSARSTARRPVLPASPFKDSIRPVIEKFNVNDRLTHDRHGLGRVVLLESETVVHVAFGSEVRRIALPNPKVTRL